MEMLTTPTIVHPAPTRSSSLDPSRMIYAPVGVGHIVFELQFKGKKIGSSTWCGVHVATFSKQIICDSIGMIIGIFSYIEATKRDRIRMPHVQRRNRKLPTHLRGCR